MTKNMIVLTYQGFPLVLNPDGNLITNKIRIMSIWDIDNELIQEGFGSINLHTDVGIANPSPSFSGCIRIERNTHSTSLVAKSFLNLVFQGDIVKLEPQES